jgi:hypothetical protein
LKLLGKVTLWILVAAATVAVALTASLFLFKDQIIQQFIREANKQLDTPVRIGQVDVTWWNNFPNIDLVFTDVYIEDSQPGEYPLHTAERISLSVNAIDLWRERYLVRRLRVEGSETSLRVSAEGVNNYTILKSSGGQSSAIAFDLNNISVADAVVTYRDLELNQDHVFRSAQLRASLSSRNDVYYILASGDVSSEKVKVGTHTFLANKTFQAEVRIDFDDVANRVDFHDARLQLGPAQFEVAGSYAFKNQNEIDLTVSGIDTDIQTLLSLLPDETSRSFSKYRSEGEVYFQAVVKGVISEAASPSVRISFGCNNATFFHPEFSSRITGANFEGAYTTPRFGHPSLATLTLNGLRGDLNSLPFTAEVKIEDFQNPWVEASFRGTLDAQSLQNFYPVESVTDFAGTFTVDASLKGEVELLKSRETAQRVRTMGSIDMKDVRFGYGPRKVPVTSLSGTLNFTNNDLALSNVSGHLGSSDFLLNGLFRNAVSYWLFEGQPIGIEADLVSQRIELDEMFDMIYGNEQSEEYAFSIPRSLLLNFNCQVGHLNYRKFNARALQGDLLIKNQMAVSRKLRFRGMGGEVILSGIVDAKNPKATDLVNTTKLSGIHLDSLFFVFDNFRQDFIKHEHLRGQADADINLEATLTPSLHIFPETLVADAGVTIHRGELINFEPLKAMKKYLNEEGLEHLYFADLRNDIHIENKTVYIPQMEVRTNVTALSLSGTHTFDQRIDYRVVAPLRNKNLVIINEATDAIETDLQGRMKVFLKITGTTDEYKVAYDAGAVKKKIASDLKKEVKELRDAFRFKGKKKEKEQQLEEEEYFDWEIQPDTVKRPDPKPRARLN